MYDQDTWFSRGVGAQNQKQKTDTWDLRGRNREVPRWARLWQRIRK